ncbi:MAG: LysR substrate-binding domain-containing protein, partial [Hyphomicrobiales bacterium]|nr:LysR substrate-binding domain-containing protein [Hyphomicrobiales bacterium]
MITLRQLRYFSALSETLHFGRAARACSVTQPALSMQIKELEGKLRLPLIERRRSGVRLTGEGREVAHRAAQILLDVQDLQDSMANRQGEMGRALALGVIPTIAPYFLPVVLPELQRRFPELELRLLEAQTDRLVEKLDRGELDAALLALPAGDARFGSMALFKDRFLLAAPAAEAIADV